MENFLREKYHFSYHVIEFQFPNLNKLSLRRFFLIQQEASRFSFKFLFPLRDWYLN